jgi:hypothetical protein
LTWCSSKPVKADWECAELEAELDQVAKNVPFSGTVRPHAFHTGFLSQNDADCLKLDGAAAASVAWRCDCWQI